MSPHTGLTFSWCPEEAHSRPQPKVGARVARTPSASPALPCPALCARSLPLVPAPSGRAVAPAPPATRRTHVNTKNRVLEPTNSAAAVATGMYLAGLRRVPGLRGILGAAPPHPSPGPDGRGRRGRAGVGGAGWTRRRTRGGGGSGDGGGNPTPGAERRRRTDVSAPLKVDREAGGAGRGGATDPRGRSAPPRPL